MDLPRHSANGVATGPLSATEREVPTISRRVKVGFPRFFGAGSEARLWSCAILCCFEIGKPYYDRAKAPDRDRIWEKTGKDTAAGRINITDTQIPPLFSYSRSRLAVSHCSRLTIFSRISFWFFPPSAPAPTTRTFPTRDRSTSK